MNFGCSICRVGFKSSAVCVATTCGHIFHKGCISQWMASSRTCPSCRSACTRSSLNRVYLTTEIAGPSKRDKENEKKYMKLVKKLDEKNRKKNHKLNDQKKLQELQQQRKLQELHTQNAKGRYGKKWKSSIQSQTNFTNNYQGNQKSGFFSTTFDLLCAYFKAKHARNMHNIGKIRGYKISFNCKFTEKKCTVTSKCSYKM